MDDLRRELEGATCRGKCEASDRVILLNCPVQVAWSSELAPSSA